MCVLYLCCLVRSLFTNHGLKGQYRRGDSSTEPLFFRTLPSLNFKFQISNLKFRRGVVIHPMVALGSGIRFVLVSRCDEIIGLGR